MSDTARLRVVAMTIGQADTVITNRRRHHPPPHGVLFALGVARGDQLVGVVIVGRPVPPAPDDGATVEITRTWSDASPYGEVALYRAAWRHARTQGYQRLITHTQAGEIQCGLREVGLRPVATVPPRAGSHTPRRERTDRGVDGVRRTRWETTAITLAARAHTGTSCTPHGRRHELRSPRRGQGSSRPAAHSPQRPTRSGGSRHQVTGAAPPMTISSERGSGRAPYATRAATGHAAASGALVRTAATGGSGQGRPHDV